ncbi:ABC transporter substrate-binding protein [Streptomyces sp. NPDC046821]|uniref:ABC transporter substrate-binding protein n=1 Tax=Streptomyces sp. NPDC046821 TaxID=3154702 RepID=UPI0033F85F82
MEIARKQVPAGATVARIGVRRPPLVEGEIVVSASDEGRAGAPGELVAYARGFLRTARDDVRFLWRMGDAWLAVQIERQVRPEPRSDEAVLSWAATELPGGVTSREIDILTLLAIGLTNGQIAERLGTSTRTVSTQVERLLLKLEQSRRGGLAALAVDAGLLRLPIPGGATGLTSIGPVEVEQRSGHAGHHDRALDRPTIVTFPGKRPFRIGTLAASYGSLTADGVEAARGSAIAVEEINARGGIGGRTVQHVVADVDILDPSSVRRGMAELIDQRVDAITTTNLGQVNPFDFEQVAEYGRPFAYLAPRAPEDRAVDADPAHFWNVLRTHPAEGHHGRGFASLFENLAARSGLAPGGGRIVLVETEALRAHTTATAFLECAAGAGYELGEPIQVPSGTPDWREVVGRVDAMDPGAVVITHLVTDTSVELRSTLRAGGSHHLLYFLHAASVPSRSGLDDIVGRVLWSTEPVGSDDPLAREFLERYRHRFGQEPVWPVATTAYDQVRMFAQAWASTGTRDPRRVAQFLRHSAHRSLGGACVLGTPTLTTAVPAAAMGHRRAGLA